MCPEVLPGQLIAPTLLWVPLITALLTPHNPDYISEQSEVSFEWRTLNMPNGSLGKQQGCHSPQTANSFYL